MEQQVTSALNSLALDAVNLLGGTDGPALQQLIEDYFCGAEQDDEELTDSTYLLHCIIIVITHKLLLLPGDSEDEGFDIEFDGNFM